MKTWTEAIRREMKECVIRNAIEDNPLHDLAANTDATKLQAGQKSDQKPDLRSSGRGLLLNRSLIGPL